MDKMHKEKKVIQSIFIISFTLAIVGFTLTQSLFRDSETSDTSTFVVGTLDMEVLGPGGKAAETIEVLNIGSSGVVSGGKTWVIKNVGTLPGELTMGIESLSNNENGCNEPESLVDSSCENPGAGQGELGAVVATQVFIQDGNHPDPIISSNLSNAAANQYSLQWHANAGTITIPAGGVLEVSLQWTTEAQSFENEIQSDSVIFDVIFDLQQVLI